jgi:hypothetical protein
MGPIGKDILCQTVTLYNICDDTDGKTWHLLTVLKNVRLSQAKITQAMSVRGVKNNYYWQLLVDRRTTKGYAPDGNNKVYMPSYAWSALPHDARNKAWTLNTGDWIYSRVGEKVSLCDEFDYSGLREQDFRAEHNMFVINEIISIIDEDGTVHHWKIVL